MITLTTEQAQQIEESLEEVRFAAIERYDSVRPSCDKALATIRAARAHANARSSIRSASEYSEQAEKEPLMDYERINALREGEQNGAEDAYFFVRPENDTPSLRKMFCQGFERGFHKGLKYAAPVQQVDLTDYEIVRLYAESPMCDSEMIAFARAVIAAYKEKNK